MKSALNLHGEVTLSRGSQNIIVRGQGSELEVEIPGMLWAFRNFRPLRTMMRATLNRIVTPLNAADIQITVRTERRRWLSLLPDSHTTILGKLGLPNARLLPR